MFTKTARMLSLLAIAFATAITTESDAQEGAWRIGPRTLPAAVDVSDVMYKSLLKTPTPDLEAAKKNTPETMEQWKEWIREYDEKTTVAARQIAKALSVTVRQDAIAGVNVYHVTPPQISPEHETHLFVHLHGGAYVVGAGEAGTFEAVLIAARLKIPVISIDYRMPPEFPAPAAIEDVVAVWRRLLKEWPEASMAMGGTSAGGGLTMASVHRFKELKLPLPAALFIGTPGADINNVGDSRFINEGIDRGLVSYDGIPRKAIALYAGNYDHKHPYVSPVYGDFSGFPPSYLISGTRDLLLSDTVRVHRRLRRAGVDADLHVYEGQSHGCYLRVMDAPESYEHFAELNAFLLKHLLRNPLKSISPPSPDTRGIEIPKTVAY